MRSTKRIIVCTEDMVSSSSYVKLLQMQGYEVYSAFSGKDLLSLFESLNYDYDLAVSDVRIPGLENFDIGDYIALKSGEFIPIIGIAEFPRDEELLMNASEGYSMIIEKGFSADELTSAVASLMGLEFHHEEGMSEDKVKERARSLEDTNTVVLDKSDFSDFIKAYGQNQSRNNMMDDISGQ